MNGEYKSENDAVVSVKDLAVLRGYGVFDFLRTYNKKPFYLNEHIKRFKRSAELTLLNCPWSDDEIRSVVNETLKKNDFPESNVRILITGGESIDSITPGDDTKFIVLVTELGPQPPDWYIDGVKIITSKTERYLPEAKSTTYLNAIIVLRNAMKKNAIESIYVDRKNNILEGTTSNIFIVKDKKIITPDKNILPGITREVILDNLAGSDVEIRDIKYDELHNIDEAFITSSNKEIVPVVEIDDIIVSDKPGPISCKVMKIFKGITDKY